MPRPRTRSALARAALPLLRGSDRLLDRVAATVGDASRTVKFLRGRASFEPRPDDVFVASYPRSGTTWTQVIVHLLVTGAQRLEFSHIADVSPWWERSLAYRDDAAERLGTLAGPRVLKTHLPYRWLPPGARYLYVWRNPADVAVSYYHLYRRYLAFDGSFDDFLHRFLRGDVQYKSWFRHVAGWERHRDEPRVLFLAYDDMRREVEPHVRRIARFLGVDASDERVAQVARASDFARMKSAQHKFDHLGELCRQWGIRDGDFIREGQVARGAGRMSPAQRSALEQASHRPVPAASLEWRLPAFLH